MKLVKAIVRLLAFGGFLLLAGILAMVPELLGDDAKEAVLKLTGKGEFVPIVLVVGVIALVIMSFWKDGKNFFGRARSKEADTATKDSLFEKARTGQREEFERRSAAKLANRNFIDIEVSYTVKGSDTLGAQMNQGVLEGQREQGIHKVFEEADGRLLIIGAPGSGKTTLLLTLAKQLIDDYLKQVPVILDIATWQPRFKTIEAWAVELLPDMGFNTTLAKEMVEGKKILALFDGLDELDEESRASFLEAVEVYGNDASKKFVITSRIDEYTGTIDAAVERQVIMEPFKMTQVREALQRDFFPERNAILHQIDHNEHFREAIQTPFYLNAVQHLYATKSNAIKLTFSADNVAGVKKEIEDAFVDNALNNIEGYKARDASKWLAFLADRMTRRGLVRFELVDMQYDWGRWGNRELSVALWLGNLVYVLVVGILVGFFSSIFYGIATNEIQGFVGGILGGLVYTIFRSFLLPYQRMKRIVISVRDKLQLSVYTIVKNLMIGSFAGVVLGVFTGVVYGLFYGAYEGIRIGAFSSVAGGVIFTILSLIEKDYSLYLRIKSPYKRFWGSIALLYFSIIQHWHLCRLLRKRSLIVRRYPVFLNAAAAAYFLETDGGSWRFRHKKIQDHFTKLWEREYAGDFPDGYGKYAITEEE